MKVKGIVFLLVLLNSTTFGQHTQWTHYGMDASGQRFVKVDEVTPENIQDLKIRWQFRTKELETYGGESYLLEKAIFEATPLMIHNNLYFPTPSNRLFAIDAKTGEQKWMFDPAIPAAYLDLSEMTCRGVSYWQNETSTKERLLMGTIDGRLFSIDMHTGRPDQNFGEEGFVDLKKGVGLVQMTSAPCVYGNLVICGTSIGDNNRTHAARGVVKAFDINSGKEVWQFDPIPEDADDAAFTSWKHSSARRTGAANVWATITVDQENDLVFLPTSSPSPDFYGGERLGNNDYANSIVALEASTGRYRWHFQVVHHDLWDYDIAAQPVLYNHITSTRDTIEAVIVGTKMGHIFMLNRLTGEHIFPVEEKAVPASDVPGEVTAPTQPFPVQLARLGLHQINTSDLYAPDDNALTQLINEFEDYNNQGIFSPPSLKGTLVTPGNIGGIHWGGMSIDPERKILVTNINKLPYLVKLSRKHSYAAYGNYLDSVRSDNNLLNPETNRMIGTPYYMSRMPWVQIQENGLTYIKTKPPWGTIVAVSLKTGNIIWEKPLGYFKQAREGEKIVLGSPNKGGTFVTESGLIFVAGTSDNFIRAFHIETGEMLWEYEMPASGIATPMTYALDGKQYIVICAGGDGKNGLTTTGDYVLCFSL